MVASTAGRAARLAASRAGAVLPKTAAAPRQVAARSQSTWSSSSSSSSASSSSKATRATLAFAGASSILVLALSSNKAPLRADSTSAPPQKRQTFGDRLRANRGGNISIPRPAEEAEEEEEEAEEVAEVVDEGVETIAHIVAEDAPLEDESQQSAYDPSTGQINWDCPCLGGMAHGPCGDQFKDAFSCFVYSEQEPKGIECVEKFKAMQDCFRAHPEVYREELEQEERDEMESLVGEAETALGIERKATLEGVASAE